MEYILSLLVFVIIGAMPTITNGWGPFEWQWWAFCIPLWLGVWLRDAFHVAV